ncbi:helix-turn-helix domain-containing protein [Enterocloster asparagiformis]|uniref:helix-turn-helix domain-containing protein n=1 Tax=Enterocloster asparagiformis TaxID=333367 RepID=UPI0006814893|nr:helix-turn-helix transcriptional regulator [Enterocloster asparagiformis]UWO76170.1 helix-turn-helix domain-containing protein [[Clostridium] asparagiforme DSM 15981]
MNEDQRKQYLIEIGNRIKQLRTEKDMSQDELAKRSGYGSRSTINKIELGINDVPQSKIKAIAEALGVSVGTLLCWDEFDESHNTIKIQKEINLIEQIEQQHGKTASEAFGMYVQLDSDDQGEIRGEMKQMLKAEKYSAKDGSSSGKAI